LLKTFENYEWDVTTEVGYHSAPSSYVEILGEKIKFALHEKVKRTDHIITEKEKAELRRYKYTSIPKWDYTPTGKLSLMVNEYGSYGLQKTFTDGVTKRIDDKLNEFVVNLYKIAFVDHQERLKREEERRRWQEEQRQLAEEARRREKEQQRLLELEKQSQLWNKSNQLRTYIKEVENRALLHHHPADHQVKLERWLLWARDHADRIDPLINGLRFDSEPEPGDKY